MPGSRISYKGNSPEFVLQGSYSHGQSFVSVANLPGPQRTSVRKWRAPGQSADHSVPKLRVEWYFHDNPILAVAEFLLAFHHVKLPQLFAFFF